MTKELIIISALKAQLAPDQGLVVTEKYLKAISEYQKYWPGKITTLVHLSDLPTGEMDSVVVSKASTQFNIEIYPSSDSEFIERIQNTSIILAPLFYPHDNIARLAESIGVPVVFNGDYSLKTEIQILGTLNLFILRKWYRMIRTYLREFRRIKALKVASGVQCSGTPTYNSYSNINKNPMLFFDGRVYSKDIITEDQLQKRLSDLKQDKKLRLVFGGRLVEMKGVQHLPKLAQELRRLKVPFTLEIYGNGPLENQLEAEIKELNLENQVFLKGVVDFDTGWMPILKNNTDLFICTHLQGDPSCTYVEVMSCGVPIAGYGNEAFVGVVEFSKCGWVVALGNIKKLAAQIQKLEQARDEIARHAILAKKFAEQNAFEFTFAKRVEHLIKLSR